MVLPTPLFATSCVVACWPTWLLCRDTGERKHHKSTTPLHDKTVCGPLSPFVLITRSVALVISPQKGREAYLA